MKVFKKKPEEILKSEKKKNGEGTNVKGNYIARLNFKTTLNHVPSVHNS